MSMTGRTSEPSSGRVALAGHPGAQTVPDPDGVPAYDVDFYSDAFIQDPYPHYARMRALGPVVWLPQLGNYALTRHEQVRAALRDHATFISGDGVAGDAFGCDFLQGNTVASDEPKHAQLRRAMAAPLLPGALSSIDQTVRETADRLIEDLVQRERFDAIADLARHLPFTIVRDMVGLPAFAQDNMLSWAAAAFDVLGVQNERGRAALETIGQMRTFIERDATRDKLKPGSWTHRIHELVDEGSLPCEHAGFAIRDYINPSLDTTISATGELIYQLSEHPDQWEALKQDPSLVIHAVNEAVRLGTPIRSFSRHAARDVEMGGVMIPAGARVMMLFASANRDERAFPDPDAFRLDRDPGDHVGFGSGIHMCVGMHLAQLEMAALLHAMIPRVRRVRVLAHEIAMNNTIRAFSRLDAVFEPETRVFAASAQAARKPAEPELLEAVITGREMVARDSVKLVLEPVEGVFPAAEAGAHIDLHLRSDLVRPYSLTGAMTGGAYEIAVQKEPDSRGGSLAVHALSVGDRLRIGGPRNSFPLQAGDGKVLLVAGGIGITPLWAMAWALHREGRVFELYIATRSKAHLAFAAELRDAPFADRIHASFDDAPDEGVFDAAGLIAQQPPGTHLYTCGPTGFMAHVTDTAKAAGWDDARLHLEHFGAEIDVDGDAFRLVTSQSGLDLMVPGDVSILSVLREAGVQVTTSCENGVCGSCLTDVVEGVPDHRDLVQTETEKASNRQMTVCCSRSRSKVLVLDI